MDEYEVVPIDGWNADIGDVIPTEDEADDAVIEDEGYDPEEPVEPSAPDELPDGEVGDEPEPDSVGYPPDEDILPTEDGDDEIAIGDAEYDGGQEDEPDIIENVGEISIIGSAHQGDVIPVVMRSGAPLGISSVGWGDRIEDEIADATVLAEEAQATAEATNQHFWHRATDPDSDGAGTGAFVTDEEQATFLEAIAAGTEPTDGRPLHNLLMNVEGILLRAAKRVRAAFTPSGVAFYDGQGNAAANVIASFGKDGAQVGKGGGYHASIGYDRFGLLYDTDRLFEVSVDGQNVDVFAGGSTKASGCKYSNAEATAIYEYLLTCHGAISDTAIYDESDNKTGYTLAALVPAAEHFTIDVLDQDGDPISCAASDGVFYDGIYVYNPIIGWYLDAQFYETVVFDPQSEIPGTTTLHAGDAKLVFTGGAINAPTPTAADDSTKIATTEWVNDLFDTFPLIQRGTVSPAAHAASSSGSTAITFADEFSASPTVIVGMRGQTQTEGIGRCSAWASNVSATGFTLNFRNDFTSSRTFGAYWVAVGGGTAGGSGGGGDTSALEQRIAELEADMQALAEATAYVGANHISIEGTTVSDQLNPITSGTIDGLEI